MRWHKVQGGFELRERGVAIEVIERCAGGWTDSTGAGPWTSFDLAMAAVEERVRARSGQGADA